MRFLYIVAGLLSFALGAVGVILPVLPTTPFLLLAAFCFGKSSKRLHDWFIGTKMYKKHLEDFVNERAMTFETKAKILGTASTMLIIAFLMVDVIYARIFIGIVFVYKYYYFATRIKTIKKPSSIQEEE
ncbi:MAG: YbaN family protein [bacterium]|nr:YbaN family protein [bacterium]